jgi:hypothetical protein
MVPVLTGVNWSLSVVLICISLIAKVDEHFFVYVLTICASSLEKCLVISIAHLLIGLCAILLLSF